nr:MAG: major capsid protein [Microviridae sp.]
MTKTTRPFKSVQTAHPQRSVFDLSYSKLLTCDMGQLIPVMCDEVVPGDKFKISAECVVRMMPLVAPVLHEINLYVHYFFVPARILWDGWETFITGGKLGDDTSVLPRFVPDSDVQNIKKYSLWDYFGCPVDVYPDDAHRPIDMPWRAYNRIWNEYYRDETLQGLVDETTQYMPLYRNWTKDYFTSALPFQQRGTAPAMPIGGHAPVFVDEDTYAKAVKSGTWDSSGLFTPVGVPGAHTDPDKAVYADLNSVSGAATDISDLRLAVQLQRYLERSARGGIRYTEWLHSMYGVCPNEARLQRPEYIGGLRSPVIVSEVLQTSETGTTPQGTMAGHGITVAQDYCGSYFAQEFGYILGIMSIMPVPMYQQGVNRQWLRTSRFDFFNPLFVGLSEQGVEEAELFLSDNEAANKIIFGYQGHFDEMRYKPNLVCADMRDTFNYWHIGRSFASAPGLNDTFLQCIPRKDIFADQADPGFLVHWSNRITAVRPLPVLAAPGFMDHF